MSCVLVVSMHIHNRDLDLWVPMKHLYASQMWQLVKLRVLEDMGLCICGQRGTEENQVRVPPQEMFAKIFHV